MEISWIALRDPFPCSHIVPCSSETAAHDEPNGQVCDVRFGTNEVKVARVVVVVACCCYMRVALNPRCLMIFTSSPSSKSLRAAGRLQTSTGPSDAQRYVTHVLYMQSLHLTRERIAAFTLRR